MVGDWLILVVCGQYEYQWLQINCYLLCSIDVRGNLWVLNLGIEQIDVFDMIDVYVWFVFVIGLLLYMLMVGYIYVCNDILVYSFLISWMISYNILIRMLLFVVIVWIDCKDYIIIGSEEGEYVQYLFKFWKFSLLVGVCYNEVNFYYVDDCDNVQDGKVMMFSFGVILDIVCNVLIWGNLVYGYLLIFDFDVVGDWLFDICMCNFEGGVKIDLFGNCGLINVLYFQLCQSNLIVGDFDNFGYLFVVLGQLGKGIDIDISGMICCGWMVKVVFIWIIYIYFMLLEDGDIVVGQVCDQYSVYSFYYCDFLCIVLVGVGSGIFGWLSVLIDSMGSYYVFVLLQIDVNGFLKIGWFDFNLGVQNLMDCKNYGIIWLCLYVLLGVL